MSTRQLEGYGAGIVREMALASRVQRGLERLYHLDRVADVDAFMHPADSGDREELLLREDADGALAIALRVPRLAEGETGTKPLDVICQIIEGVSHFVYVTDRAAMQKRTTQLELELQAEVDKYVVLAASVPGFDKGKSEELRGRLYDNVQYAHDEDSERGERYRVANEAAARFVRRLEPDFLQRGRIGALRSRLRSFFHEGLEAKLRMART
ncbi:MAG: hypothetical protein HOO96_33125 [Polyangiaceae bacterium]|nr:hypothetical protein [Polyangiaceae bacterium]